MVRKKQVVLHLSEKLLETQTPNLLLLSMISLDLYLKLFHLGLTFQFIVYISDCILIVFRSENSVHMLIGQLSGHNAQCQLEAARCLHELSHSPHPSAGQACLPAGPYLLTYLSSQSTKLTVSDCTGSIRGTSLSFICTSCIFCLIL